MSSVAEHLSHELPSLQAPGIFLSSGAPQIISAQVEIAFSGVYGKGSGTVEMSYNKLKLPLVQMPLPTGRLLL